MNPFDASSQYEPSFEEQSHYNQIFQKLFEKAGNIGAATEEKVLKAGELISFLSSSNVPKENLSKIWELAGGIKKNGLDKASFAIACKLISLCQANLPLTPNPPKTPMANFSMPLPSNSDAFATPARSNSIADSFSNFKGISSTPVANTNISNMSWSSTPMAIQKTGASMIVPTATGSFPGLICTPEERSRFSLFFESAGPVDGFLAGSIAQSIFIKSQLTPDILAKVWNLADKDQLGKFSVNHFCLALWIISKIKVGLLKQVPESVSPSLWNSIATPSSVESRPAPPPLGGSNFRNDMTSTTANGPNAKEKMEYGAYFDQIDTSKKMVLSGSECFPILSKSGLDGADLAQIWDLVDEKKQGTITKDGFIMAMFLIKKRMAGNSVPAGNSANLLDLNSKSPTGTPTFKKTPQPAASDLDLLQGISMAPSATAPGFQPPITLQQPLITKQPTSSPALPSLESRDLDSREKTLLSRQQELQSYQTQLGDIGPIAEQTRQRREQVDLELRKVTEKRNQVMIEVTSLRGEYELDMETLRDRQVELQRFTQDLEARSAEATKYRAAIVLAKKENASLLEKINNQKKQMEIIVAEVTQLEADTTALRETTHTLFDDAKQVNSAFQAHAKELDSKRQEHEIVKKNLDFERGRLEQEKKKVSMLEQQASVQQAIIDREKERIESMERERESVDKNRIKTEEMLGSMQSLDAKRETRSEILAKAISHEEIVIPVDQPAPPLPPASTKPLKSSLTNLTESSSAKLPETSVALVESSQSPAAKTPASVISMESTKSRKEKESFDLESLLSSNKPKSANSNATPATLPTSSVGGGATSSGFDFDSLFGPLPPLAGASPAAKGKPGPSTKLNDSKTEDISALFDSAKLMPAAPIASSATKSIPTNSIVDSNFTFDSSFGPPKISLGQDNLSEFAKQSGSSAFSPMSQDLDGAFGGSVSKGQNNPFGVGNPFDSFPPPPTSKSSHPSKNPVLPAASSNSNDSPEVTSIVQMGFTKQQALMALESHGQSLERAVEYLLAEGSNMNQQQLDHLHAKFTGTGHADTNRYEFLTHHHRDSIAVYTGNSSLLSYLATAEGESTERTRLKYVEKFCRPCGPPLEKD